MCKVIENGVTKFVYSYDRTDDDAENDRRIDAVIAEINVDYNASRAGSRSQLKVRTICEITESNQWIDIEAKIVQLWESRHSRVAQIGLIGDGTGVMKFQVWESAFPHTLQKGVTYRFENVVVGEHANKLYIKVNSRSIIREVM